MGCIRLEKKNFLVHQQGATCAEIGKCDDKPMSYAAALPPPPPCISYANVRNYYSPYAQCSLDKGVACAKLIQLPTPTCERAWYGCTLTSAHISKCMQTPDSLGNMKISGSHPCWHKQQRMRSLQMFGLETLLATIHHAEQLHMLPT